MLEKLARESCPREETPPWTLTSWADKKQAALVLGPRQRLGEHTPIVCLPLTSANCCFQKKPGPRVWPPSVGILGLSPSRPGQLPGVLNSVPIGSTVFEWSLSILLIKPIFPMYLIKQNY